MAIQSLIDQTLATRQTIVKVLKSIPHEFTSVVPPTWSNNAHWHAGHLIVTPYLLTYGVMKEPLLLEDNYKDLFAKGTGPASWEEHTVPTYEDLVDNIVSSSGKLFESLRDRWEIPYVEPYTTSVGIILKSPVEALQFSLMHDGIHLGMLLALRRALQIPTP